MQLLIEMSTLLREKKNWHEMSLSEFFLRPDGNVGKQTPSEMLWLRRHTNKAFIQSSGSLGK